MPTHRIALYPGDGIGSEVIEQAVRVLDAVASPGEMFELDFTSFPWGYEHWKQHGRVVPDDFLETLRGFDAILLGAVGWPDELPDHITLAPLVAIRQSFDQYACMRPVRLFPGVRSPLAGKQPGEVDFLVIRENSEGEYVHQGGRFRRGQPDEVALQTAVHTRRGVERILRFAFEQALGRRKRLVMATKSNALGYAYVMWDEVLQHVRGDYPDVTATRQHADALAMDFVRRPEELDVVVASNLFGDILTDLGGAIGGGLGLAPSTNINPERTYPSMFEPVHGSAPDIAGRGIANPTACILSAAMMLDWLDENAAAARIRRAVEQAIAAGAATPDLGGKLTAAEMGTAVVERL